MNKTIRFNPLNTYLLIDRIIIFVFLITTAYVRIIENDTVMLTVCSVCLSIAGLLNTIKIVRNKEFFVILIISLYLLAWIVEVVARPIWHYDYRFLISSLSYLGIAYSFLTNKRKVLPYIVLYYAIALFILFEIFVGGVSYLRIMKEGSSYNYISVLLLFYLLLLNFVQIYNNKEIGFVPGIVFLVVAVVSYGRGGIITALVYNAVLVLSKAVSHKSEIKTYLIGMALIIGVLFYAERIVSGLINQGYFNKFIKFGMDNNGRAVIWTTFLETCTKSFGEFVLGGDPRVLYFVEYNTHNSFLQLYASFGLVLALIIVALFSKRIVELIKNHNYYMLVIVIAFITRAMTDKLMYRGYSEVVFYIFLFYNHIKNNESTSGEVDMSCEKAINKKYILRRIISNV